MKEKIKNNNDKNIQQFLKVFLDNLPYPIFVKRFRDGSFVYWNKAEEKLVGIPAEKAIDKTDYDIVPKDQAEFFRKMDEEVFKKGSILIIPEEPVYMPHLGNRILRTAKTPIYDDNNQPLFLLGISEDITEAKMNEEELKKYRKHLEELVVERTKELEKMNHQLQTEIIERKHAQQAVTDSKNFLDKIINSISDPVFVKNREHQWVLLNDSMCSFIGHAREDMIGKTDYDFFPEEEARVFWNIDEQVFSSGTENTNEEAITDSMGSTHIISTKKTLYRDDQGVEYIVGVFRDITELKQASRELENHRNHLEDLVRLRTSELRQQKQELQEVNTLLEEQKEELMQQKEELQSTLENLQKTQEQLIESEKMAALGGLVAGVAHEINTPVGIGVTAISNLMEEVKRMASLYKKDEVSRKVFKEFLESVQDTSSLIMKNLERTASLIQSFKQVSIDQVSEQQRVFKLKGYLNDIILSLIPKYKHKNITFKVECEPDLELNSYPGAYAQIFTNLLLNSFKHGFAEREKGTVSITANQKNNTLNIEYRDDGTGIDPKDLPHVFEPFYTSDKRKGSGLGLNIIYNIIRQKLHGTITCESKEGSGVLFKMDIPVYPPAINEKQ